MIEQYNLRMYGTKTMNSALSLQANGIQIASEAICNKLPRFPSQTVREKISFRENLLDSRLYLDLVDLVGKLDQLTMQRINIRMN